jgi:hypothetical protein
VYATGDHFEEAGAPVEAIVRRTDELCRAAVGLNEALKLSQASVEQVL